LKLCNKNSRYKTWIQLTQLHLGGTPHTPLQKISYLIDFWKQMMMNQYEIVEQRKEMEQLLEALFYIVAHT